MLELGVVVRERFSMSKVIHSRKIIAATPENLNCGSNVWIPSSGEDSEGENHGANIEPYP